MPLTSSYVVKGENGEQFIPASQRADGSWRKARKVKDGYIPQDEVPIYQSKGKQWASSRPSYPVGIDPALIREKELKEKLAAEKLQKKQNSNAQKVPPGFPQTTPKPAKPAPAPKPSNKNEKTKTVAKKSTLPDTASIPGTVQSETPAADPLKRLRNLKKKLKEIEALELKIKNKELKTPDKDQVEKMLRKPLIEDEILALELSLSLTS